MKLVSYMLRCGDLSFLIIMNDVDEKDKKFLFFISRKKEMKLVACYFDQ